MSEGKAGKLIKIVFVVLFLAITISPALYMNTKPKVKSELDNRNLREFPKMDINFTKNFEPYMQDRIGFRKQMLAFYGTSNDALFQVLVYPSYMYGKDGYIFYKDPGYIADYQHLNINKAFIKSFSGYIQRLQTYLESNGVGFLYMLTPDKKSVYSEYFPETVHVNGTESRTSLLTRALDNKGVRYVFPLNELIDAHHTQQVYNVKYDAAHWNEDGAMIAYSMMIDKLREKYPTIRPLKAYDFEKSTARKSYLPNSNFPINEDVPVYTLKSESITRNDAALTGLQMSGAKKQYAHYENKSASDAPKALIFGDSYLLFDYTKFLTGSFSDVTFVHNTNFMDAAYLVDLLQPDVVVFQNVERVLTDNFKIKDLDAVKFPNP